MRLSDRESGRQKEAEGSPLPPPSGNHLHAPTHTAAVWELAFTRVALVGADSILGGGTWCSSALFPA